MLLKTLRWVFYKPIERHVRFAAGLGKNGRDIVRATRRGLPWNWHKYPPVVSDMPEDQVRELEAWWKRADASQRRVYWANHKREVRRSISEEVSARAEYGKQIWSLTQDELLREKALNRQKTAYWFWTVMFAVSAGGIAFSNVVMEVSFLYRLSSIAFLAFLFPEFARHRIARAQLLYGRRINPFEFFRPLPAQLHDLSEPQEQENFS